MIRSSPGREAPLSFMEYAEPTIQASRAALNPSRFSCLFLPSRPCIRPFPSRGFPARGSHVDNGSGVWSQVDKLKPPAIGIHATNLFAVSLVLGIESAVDRSRRQWEKSDLPLSSGSSAWSSSENKSKLLTQNSLSVFITQTRAPSRCPTEAYVSEFDRTGDPARKHALLKLKRTESGMISFEERGCTITHLRKRPRHPGHLRNGIRKACYFDPYRNPQVRSAP